MTATEQTGPSDRERWTVAQIVKAAALAVDATRSSDKNEREYGRGELIMTAKLLVEGADKLSKNQIENLREFADMLVEMTQA